MDLRLLQGTLSSAQPAMTGLHDSFFQKINSNTTVELMTLDALVLPWLIYYYQTAQAECGQFRKNQLLKPFLKETQFDVQLKEFESWLEKNLEVVQQRQQAVNQKLKSIWDSKCSSNHRSLDTEDTLLSDKQWSDWNSKATARNQGFYDTAVFISIPNELEIKHQPPTPALLGRQETQSEPSIEEVKKQTGAFGWGWFLSGFRWIKSELPLVSGVSLITTIILMTIFSPSLILVVACLTAAVGFAFSILRPMWHSIMRYWSADTKKVDQYYQFTESFWFQSLENFQHTVLDSDQSELQFYRFELPLSLYQNLCEIGLAIEQAMQQRKPEHAWKKNYAHLHYRKKQQGLIHNTLEEFKSNFISFHQKLVIILYQSFKNAVVKKVELDLVLHVDKKILYTLHSIYNFLEIRQQLTIEKWIKDFFDESLESSFEMMTETYMGLALKKIKSSVKDRLRLQYELLSIFWKVSELKFPEYLQGLMVKEDQEEIIQVTDLPKDLMLGFQSFCSQTFKGEYWKIPYLPEQYRRQLQSILDLGLVRIGISIDDLQSLDIEADQRKAIHALMKKGVSDNNLVDYFNLLNCAWNLYCVLSTKTETHRDQYLQKKQVLEFLLESWLLSLDTDRIGIEASMIQVLLLSRFDLSHSRRDTYQSDQREKDIHRIWWYLVRNWLTYHFNQYSETQQSYNSTEIDLIKKYYQVTKKIDIEPCESWLESQLQSHSSDQNKLLIWLQCNRVVINCLNIPRLTQIITAYQQSYIPALQEVQHAISLKKRSFFSLFR